MKLPRVFIVYPVILAIAGIVPLYGNDWAFGGTVPGGHRGPVSALVHREDIVISAGEDGFLEIWDTGPAAGHASQRFQVSPYSIISMAARPGKDEVCLVESDGLGLYRVSAWNYRERNNLFTLRFRDPISHITYSTGGSFIIAARTGRTGIVIIDSNSGGILQSPQDLTGNIGLAVTGRSERNMMIYLTSGVLSYWDLETGTETNRFNVPQNLFSPAFFGNNRFLAGVNAEGLSVVHAASGEMIAGDRSVPDGSLLCPAGDDFYCLIQKDAGTAELNRYTVDRNNRLINLKHFSIFVSGDDHKPVTMAGHDGANGTAALGTAGGGVIIASQDGHSRYLSANNRIQITDAAVSGPIMAFLAENGTIGFIPLDYSQLQSGRAIRIEQNGEGLDRITAFAPEHGSGGDFILWQDRNTRTPPVIRSSNPEKEKSEINGITLRTPIRSTASFGGKIAFLDSTGNLSVVSPFDGEKEPPFTFFSVGLMDAAFVNSDQLVLGRSAVSGNTPFLLLNIKTGETVPLPYASQAGAALYRGASDNIYAITISSQQGQSGDAGTAGIRTSILQFNSANSANSVKLVEFEGEDTQFSLAETPGGIAATIGGEGAAIYSGAAIQKLDMTPGLPLRLFNGGNYLISLDGDSNICWYDSRHGKLLAVFSLHPDGWTLQTEKGVIGNRD